MAIRTNFCQKKCVCRILSGQNLENFAQGQIFCPVENCQLQRGRMDIRTIFVSHYSLVAQYV
jgi:hypothetical protein